MSSEGKSKFSLTALFVVVGVSFLLFLVLLPAFSGSTLTASMIAVKARGKDIYVAIIQANTERDLLGLPSVLPRTPIGGGRKIEDVRWAPDIAQMEFQNSTDYFNELIDGANFRTDKWAPYVSGFDDYSRFAGAGVPTGNAKKKLLPKNNMWSIAGDIEDDTPDILPVLVTRNVDCASFYRILQGKEREEELWSKHYKTPYSNKGFVLVRKGGATFHAVSRWMNIRALYHFSTQPPPDVVDGLLLPYLTPDSLVTPPQRSSP